MSNTQDFIDPAELVDRGVYRIRSRNLPYGVYRAASRGFIGIREKMGAVYLFEEYEWDTSAMHGTARALEYLGQLPDDIEMRESNPSMCQKCGKPAFYNNEKRDAWRAQGLAYGDFPGSPWECGGNCADPKPMRTTYAPLFEYLMGVDLEMTRCAECGEVAFYGTPWKSDVGSWKHVGGFGWMVEDESDHEVVPT